MTRFSPEYIAFILSDEAKVLQERWKPALGDWYSEKWYEELQLIGSNRELTHLIANAVETWAKWVPTLTALLDMIEEIRRKQCEAQGLYSTPILKAILTEVAVGCAYMDDAMLVAATLAVRVLEEGKE